MSKTDSDHAALLRAANKEEKRIRAALVGMAPEKKGLLNDTIKNAAWMKVQLERARETIAAEPIVVEYDNGGGQSGLREHPAYKAYEALFKSYMLAINKLSEAMPVHTGAIIDEAEKPQTALELVRMRVEKRA